jgi:hypothetical protein
VLVKEPEPEPLPKVTLAHLRRAGTMCRLRLAHEHHDRRGNWPANARWRVSNQLLEDARLTHTDLGPPVLAHFRPGADLSEEERRVSSTAARWYVALYPRPVRTVEVDRWETAVDELGVRLVGPAGLPVEGPGGQREVRLLRFGSAPPPADLLDASDVRFALLRLARWVPAHPLRVSIADLVLGRCQEQEVDTRDAWPELRRWLADRIAVIRDRIVEPVPRAGLECAACAFVAGCPAHRRS